MSKFAAIVRSRIDAAQANGSLADGGGPLRQQISDGTRVLQHLTTSNAACAADVRCLSVWRALGTAYQGTRADARTALTRLQDLLRSLTAEDADIAGEEIVQSYRKRLHLLLDH